MADQYQELRDLIYGLAEAIAGAAIAKNDTHLAGAVIAAVRKQPVTAPDLGLLNTGATTQPAAPPPAPAASAPARRLTQDET